MKCPVSCFSLFDKGHFDVGMVVLRCLKCYHQFNQRVRSFKGHKEHKFQQIAQNCVFLWKVKTTFRGGGNLLDSRSMILWSVLFYFCLRKSHRLAGSANQWSNCAKFHLWTKIPLTSLNTVCWLQSGCIKHIRFFIKQVESINLKKLHEMAK